MTGAFPAARRGAIIGISGGIGGLAIAGGPLVGGAVVQGLSWDWTFWINVPIGLAAAVLSVVHLPDSRGPAARLDLPAVPLIAGATVAIAWALVRAGGTGWSDPKVIAAFCLGTGLLAGFVIRERRATEPMLPLRLFRVRAFSAANATAFLMSGAIFSAAFLTSQYLQLGMGYSPLATGLRLLPWTAAPVLVAPGSGALADRIGARPLLITGLALQAAGLAWIADMATASGGYARFVAPLIIAGAGISMALPATATAALGAVQPADIGRASGVNNTLQRFGGAFGVAIATAVFSAHGHLGSPASVASGYRPALAASAGQCPAGGGPGRRCHGRSGRTPDSPQLTPLSGSFSPVPMTGARREALAGADLANHGWDGLR